MTAAPPGTIGFAIRDTHGRGCAFEVDQLSGEALVFGSNSALRLSGEGVLPAHFVVLPHEGKLMAASASAERPAVLNGRPLSTSWTELEVPSRIRVGTASVDFFHVRESGMILIDLDVETTVALPGARSPDRATAITRPETPVPRAAGRVPAVPAAPAALAVARERAGRAIDWSRRAWKGAPRSTRILLGVVAVLVVFVLARPTRDPAPAPAAAAAIRAADAPLAAQSFAPVTE